MNHPLRYFAVASLCPVVLIALGAVFGGVFAGLALVYMTVLAFALDEGVAKLALPADPEDDFTAANRLSAILAVAHFLLLPLVVFALSGGTNIGVLSGVLVFFAAGLFFGQVSNSNAHELIHRTDKLLFNLGKWVYISVLFGHHTSAHPKVHHRFVATEDDPNSARDDESFYDFAPRAWMGALVAGYEMERAEISRRSKRRLNPYVTYLIGGLLMLIIAATIGGFIGVLAYLLLCAYAQVQLLLSDYVQHYGLQRARLADGSYEPIGDQHSWNAPHWFTTHLMMNAPRHSDHHSHPMRPYPALTLPNASQAPILPYSLPTMATLALFPSRWRKVMDPRVAKWRTRANAPIA